MADQPLSIPSLASHLGVSPPAVRNWITSGLITPPSTLTASRESAYHREAVQEIERWYAERASTRSTRGPGAVGRRERAERWFREREGQR